MLKQRGRAIDAGLRIVDVGLLFAAFPLAYWLRDCFFAPRYANLFPIRTYWPMLALSILLWVATAWVFDVYQAYRTRTIPLEVGRIARAMVVTGCGIAAFNFFAHEHQLSRLFVGTYVLTGFALLAANRAALRLISRSVRRRGYNTRNFAVVGSGEKARAIVQTMRDHPGWGWRFAGYVLEEGVVASTAHGRVLGWVEDLPKILEENVLDEVIFAAGREHLDGIELAVQQCEEQGVAAKVCIDFFHRKIARTSVEELGDVPVLGFTTTPTDPVALFAKRAFDLVASGLALLVLAPLFAVVAGAIRWESKGPVFFRQRRVGLNGREFWLLKFRSMHVDAEAKLAALQKHNEASGPVFKMRNDPRVTRVGRFIRKTSIDELPQLINVLRGEMSVVGPRPPIMSEVRQYQRWQRRRLSIKPGITCTWQVSGRSDISFDRWMELDLEYIDNWSLWHDLKICFRTIPAVFSGRGAR
jgi:exopolysaccharide biosynthesis polyprenyl glycosylphosphotransferase